MKKKLLLSLFCVSILLANAQDFRVKDIQLIPLSIFHTNKKQDNFDTGGVHFGIDLGFDIYKQDIRLQLNTGSELNIMGKNTNSFSSINLLYELSPRVFTWMKTEVYAGIGLNRISFVRSRSISIDNTYFNVPLGTRFMFFSQNRISLGLQFQSDFNYDNTTFIYSTVLRYNLKNTNKKTNP